MIEFKILNDDDIIKSEDGLIFNPYNPNNNEITLNDVQSILARYGVPGVIDNIELYKRAFIHRSYTKRPHLENVAQNITIVDRPEDCMPLKTKSNERLEFLGDGVLELITKYYLYRRFPKENEGFMTEKKIAIVKNEAIGKIAYEMRLHKWLILSKHAEDKKLRTNLKKLGCLFESFLGALFLDFNKITIKDEDAWFENIFVTGPGFQIAQKFIEAIFEKHIDWVELIQNDDNYKNIENDKILPGDIILYFSDNGDIEHSGIVISEPSQYLKIPDVLSKWGKYKEVIHAANVCPYTYNVKYYRVR